VFSSLADILARPSIDGVLRSVGSSDGVVIQRLFFLHGERSSKNMYGSVISLLLGFGVLLQQSFWVLWLESLALTD
jgi:hypothetical protein